LTEVLTETREQLDSGLIRVDRLAVTGSFQAAEQALIDAQELYELLEEYADPNSQIQQRVCFNRSSRIQALETRISQGLFHREEGKREDGSIAFKCNWNDKGYKGICSDAIYEMNRRSSRSQCARSCCRDYVDTGSATECCYECRALIECSFGAGWDHDDKGTPTRPRKLWNARQGKIALLTTIPPYTRDRLIVAAFQISRVQEDPFIETVIYGDQNSLVSDMLDYSIQFWDHHVNPGKPESKAWGQGLFRYVSDEAILGILTEYRNKKIGSGGNTDKVDALLRCVHNTN